MLKKSVVLFLFVLLLYSFTVSALSFNATSETINNTISLEGIAEFDLTVFNYADTTQEYRLVKLDYPYWDVYRPGYTTSNIKVYAHKSSTIRLLVQPLHVSADGPTDVKIRLRKVDSDEELNISLRVNLVTEGSLIKGYVPTVITNVEIPTEIDPKKELEIKVRLDNQNMLDYKELTVKLNSNTINKEITEPLGPKEKKDLTVKITLDPTTKPQDDTLIVTTYMGNELIDGPRTTNFKIISYSELSQIKKEIGGFLKLKKEITFTNIGNDVYDAPIKVETTILRGLFTFTNPRAKIISENGKRYVKWDAKINPGDSLTVTLTENYTLLLFILILIIIGIIAYYIYQSPLVLTKEYSNVENREGGISELKVIIKIRNRGNVALKDITIKDVIPNIANIEKELTIGTLQPIKILKHDIKGSLLKWIIDDLGAGEERVITYRIRAVLSIIGAFSLPSATAKFTLNNEQKISRSNSRYFFLR